MRHALRLALLAAAAVALTGCRFKGYESFSAATTPGLGTQRGEFGESAPKGSPQAEWGKYSYGGIADATGGQDPRTRYGLGAKADGSARPGYDQPQKGSGQQPGEYPNAAQPGYARTNAPSFQPTPSDVGNGSGL